MPTGWPVRLRTRSHAGVRRSAPSRGTCSCPAGGNGPGRGRASGRTWKLRDGPAKPDAWIRAAYADRALVTRVELLHADHATPDDQPAGTHILGHRAGAGGADAAARPAHR